MRHTTTVWKACRNHLKSALFAIPPMWGLQQLAILGCRLLLRRFSYLSIPIVVSSLALSQQVAAASGRSVSWQKSVVGQGVFTHEAGIHVDGLLKHPDNYQGFDPSEVGRSHRIVLGKHSGPRAVMTVYARLGVHLDTALADQLLARVRTFVVQHKRPPEDSELMNLLTDQEIARHA